MAEKAQVRVITVYGDHFLHQTDVVRLILECADALPDADARQMVKELANNIMKGKIKEGRRGDNTTAREG